jgi:hypothetical protein
MFVVAVNTATIMNDWLKAIRQTKKTKVKLKIRSNLVSI